MRKTKYLKTFIFSNREHISKVIRISLVMDFGLWGDLDKIRVSCLSDRKRFFKSPLSESPFFLFSDSGGLNV